MITAVQEMKNIQVEIDKLHKKKAEIVEQEKEAHAAEIKKLDWLRGKTVKFEHGMLAAGLPEFTLTVGGSFPVIDAVIGFNGSVNLYGDHKLYEYNITLRRKEIWGFYMYCMETSSAQTLSDFIKEARLKIDFSERHQLLYSTILDNLSTPSK